MARFCPDRCGGSHHTTIAGGGVCTKATSGAVGTFTLCLHANSFLVPNRVAGSGEWVRGPEEKAIEAGPAGSLITLSTLLLSCSLCGEHYTDPRLQAPRVTAGGVVSSSLTYNPRLSG
ncbi:hypothetical protein DPEC_G00359710 [Dallia pectoralis]|uniref:Uncharacterized protein n=1 Tax=Dallia pectoralis TaxID=75939 RepID=A0ACC2F113_DALPE|nr:hypothetical protein DPEC_G00359710 [Dallia pectoralis]